MNQSTVSGTSGVADGHQSLSGAEIRERVAGLATILFGLGQVILAFALTGMMESTIPFVILVIGGSVLIGGGISLIQGEVPLIDEWGGSEQIKWAGTAVRVAFAVGVLIAALWFAL